MSRPRNPKRDEARRLYDDSGGTIVLSDLAKKLGLPASRIRKWKAEDQWERSDSEIKERSFTQKARKKIKKRLFDSVDNNEELTERERLFCVFYNNSHNATQSYLKAYGGIKGSAGVLGHRLTQKVKIQKTLKELRDIMRTDIDIEVYDLLRYCMKVVGADIGDYVKFGREKVPVMGASGPVIDKKTKKPITREINAVKLQESESVDTSILQEVKQGKDGVSIKLADKKWAWEQLSKMMGWQPAGDTDESDAVQIVDDSGDADEDC